LIAANPELASGGGAEPYDAASAEIWLADGLCEQIASLQHGLTRYIQLLDRLQAF
jgi:hypothetical protein